MAGYVALPEKCPLKGSFGRYPGSLPGGSHLRLQADLAIDGTSERLLTAEIAFRRLH